MPDSSVRANWPDCPPPSLKGQAHGKDDQAHRGTSVAGDPGWSVFPEPRAAHLSFVSVSPAVPCVEGLISREE
jgi:hypothetical protein